MLSEWTSLWTLHLRLPCLKSGNAHEKQFDLLQKDTPRKSRISEYKNKEPWFWLQSSKHIQLNTKLPKMPPKNPKTKSPKQTNKQNPAGVLSYPYFPK